MEDSASDRGRVVWYSSDECGAPDVGRSIGLGDGWHLWIGQITRKLYEATDLDHDEFGNDFGTWIILYGPTEDDTKVIGKGLDPYIGEALIERLALALRGTP